MRASTRKGLIVSLALLVFCTLGVGAVHAAGPTASNAQIEACFSPPLPGGCDPTKSVVHAIEGARKAIRLQMYALTSREITRALVDAKRKGIDVRVIVDHGQLYHDRSEARAVNSLIAAGVPVLVDENRGLMHDKVMIIDQETVLTGSFNYTWSAEHQNAENLLVIHDSGLAAEYIRAWDRCAAQSHPLRRYRH